MTIAGWTSISGAFTRTSGIGAGREVALIAAVLSCWLIYVVARRVRMGRATAMVAVALFALSPLALENHRMVWLDNIATPWLLASLALALSPQRRLWAFAGSGVCFAAAVLTKETYLLLLPVIAYAAWRNADPRTRSLCLTVAGAFLCSLVFIYPLYAILKGELFPGPDHVSIIDAIHYQLSAREGSGSIFDPSSDARRTLEGWLRVDAWLLGLGALLTPVALASRRLRAIGLGMAICLVMLLRTGYLPAPYVVVMFPFAALVIAGAVDVLAAWNPPARIRVAMARLRVTPGRLAAAGAVALAVLVMPGWLTADVRLVRSDASAPQADAVEWIVGNVPRDQHLLIDDTMWVDLVEAGFAPERVVWFFKIDFDPGVTDDFPGGYRDFDYVVTSPAMRSAPRVDETRRAIVNSRPVAVFGEGGSSIEVRRIEHLSQREA
jgi:uncharacterized membrane protein YhaH (DUF805 family)